MDMHTHSLLLVQFLEEQEEEEEGVYRDERVCGLAELDRADQLLNGRVKEQNGKEVDKRSTTKQTFI